MNYMTKKRLPNEYQEVEYVQSSGTQYIDTGVKLSSADTVKAKFEITARPSDYNYRDGVYGTMETQGGTNTFFVLLMRDPNQARVGSSTNQVSSTNLALNTIYDTTLSNGTYIENGTTYTFTPHSGFTFTTNCWFFRRNQTSMLATSAKFYSFEIVGKFKGIPCYRKSDNVIGFYDLISETFFTNAGTGDFTKGNDVGAVVSKNIGILNSTRILPEEYQRINYIESTGTQWINTNLSAQNGYKIKCSASFANGANKNISGIQTGGGAKRAFGPWCASQTGNKFSLGIGVGGAVNTDKIYNINQKYELEANLSATNPYLTVDGVNATFTASPGGALSSAIPSGDIYLFALNNGGSVATGFVGKLYDKIQIFISDVLVREFIPCYRKSDNVVGLYDTVNNIFYTNQGTGNFIAGIIEYRGLPKEYQQVEYLGVASDNPYIDTGVTGDQNTKAEVTFSSVETLASCLFGYQANAVGITFNLSEQSNNTRFGAWAKVGWGFDMFDGKKHIVEISQQGLYQDGTLVDTPTAQTFTTGNLTLFKADGAVTYGDKTIYGCRIWNNGVLQRDLVPCYRKSDNVKGMYDMVSKNFYSNEGTGAFTKGSNIEYPSAYKITITYNGIKTYNE